MIPPPQGEQVKRIPPTTIRRMYNKSQYPSLIAQELLKPEYLRNDHLKEPGERGKPQCTHSQTIRYYDKSGRWVVVVYQYWHQDKTIKGTRRPDPKRLRVGNKIFIVDTKQIAS